MFTSDLSAGFFSLYVQNGRFKECCYGGILVERCEFYYNCSITIQVTIVTSHKTYFIGCGSYAVLPSDIFISPASQLALLSGRTMQLMANHPTAGSAVRFRHAYFKLSVWLTIPAFFSTLTHFICRPVICGHFLLCKVQLGRSYGHCLFKTIHFPHGRQ